MDEINENCTIEDVLAFLRQQDFPDIIVRRFQGWYIETVTK